MPIFIYNSKTITFCTFKNGYASTLFLNSNNYCPFYYAKSTETKISKSFNSSLTFQCIRQKGANGGFADRVKGIFSSFLISIALNRSLMVDYTELYQVFDILHVETLGTQKPQSTEIFVNSIDSPKPMYKLCDKKIFTNIVLRTNQFIIPSGQHCRVKYPEMEDFFKNSKIAIMQCLWWSLFKLKPRTIQRIQNMFFLFHKWIEKQKIENYSTIGVHVRVGDSHMHAGHGREQQNYSHFLSKMQTCLLSQTIAKNDTKKTIFVVVSDSIQAKYDMSLWNHILVYPSNEVPVHIDKSTSQSTNDLISVVSDLFFFGSARSINHIRFFWVRTTS